MCNLGRIRGTSKLHKPFKREIFDLYLFATVKEIELLSRHSQPPSTSLTNRASDFSPDWEVVMGEQIGEFNTFNLKFLILSIFDPRLILIFAFQVLFCAV